MIPFRSLLVGAVVTWAPVLSGTETPKPKYRPPAHLELLSNVIFGQGGGRDLHAEILRPKARPKASMPAVLLIHGGGWAGGSHIGYCAPWLAEKGYFTASIEYRLSGEAPWPAQIEDCKLAVRWLRANAAKYQVNPDRIGCMGHSAGGHLAACLGTLGGCTAPDGQSAYARVSSRVQAVVDQCGPADFTPDARPAVGTERIAQSLRLADALRKAGVPVEFIRIKNAGHGLRADRPQDPPAEPDSKALQGEMLEFFNKYLKR